MCKIPLTAAVVSDTIFDFFKPSVDLYGILPTRLFLSGIQYKMLYNVINGCILAQCVCNANTTW